MSVTSDILKLKKEKNADIIVLEGGMNLVAMDMIKNRIRQHLSAQTQV